MADVDESRDVVKELYPDDPVAKILNNAPGRLKLMRKDGVTSPRCAAELVEMDPARDGDDLGKALTRWGDNNRTALIFDIHVIDRNTCLVLHSMQMSEKQLRVMDRYGRKLGEYMEQAEKEEAEQLEKDEAAKQAAEKERNHYSDVGKTYEKRLLGIKKMKDSRTKTKLFQELERGGMHYELFLETLTQLMLSKDPEEQQLAKFAESLADKLNIAGLLKAEVAERSKPKTEEKTEEATDVQG